MLRKNKQAKLSLEKLIEYILKGVLFAVLLVVIGFIIRMLWRGI